LDIDTLNVLEEFLENFPGVLILVSHDRYLLDKMSEQLFIMEGNGEVTIYNGNYSEYRLSLDIPKEKPVAKEVKSASPTPSKKLSYKEQKELESSEQRIEELEKEIETLGASLLLVDSNDYLKLQEIGDQIDKHRSELDLVSSRWLELSELNS
ncbi:MAG: ABC transporter ATP-binding protein, partial [Pedobacter sp.]